MTKETGVYIARKDDITFNVMKLAKLLDAGL